MSASLFAPPLFTDPALRQGEVIADRCVGAIRQGASDPDLVMRCVLQVLADAGCVAPPTTLLRGFCGAVQRELSGGADRATTD